MRWIDDELARLGQSHQLRSPVCLATTSGTPTRCVLDGRELVVFCSNDYLGMRVSDELSTSQANPGAGASRLVSGHHPLHEAAENSLAELTGRPAALLVSSGYAANVGAIPALAGEGDVLFSDSLNHASIVDGCRLSRGRTVVFPHADTQGLCAAVQAARPFRRGWVLTESLFSMDGDTPALADYRALCDSEGLHLYVDEAHAIGLYGPGGSGLCAAQHVCPDVLVGTLGKALGLAGAFITGSQNLRLFLWNRCRSFVFSTGVHPSLAAGAQRSATIVRRAEPLRRALFANVDRLRQGAARRGIPLLGRSDGPIAPLVLGHEQHALALSHALRERGFFVQAIRPPTVPPGTSRLRITISAAHQPHDIDAFLDALSSELSR